MNDIYKVVYGGTLKSGTDTERFVQGFMQIFKASEVQARKFVTLGKAITLKDRLDAATAEKYRQVMDKLGMQVHVEAMTTASTLNQTPPRPTPQPAASPRQDEPVTHCPKCGSHKVKGDDCLACGIIISRYQDRLARVMGASAQNDNPYAAPQSDVTPVNNSEPGGMSGPHRVPAANGWKWITGGWSYFRRNPFAWIGAVVVWILLMMAGSLIPFIGSLAINLLSPVLIAGFLIGANEQRRGGSFQVRHLFAGFSNHAGELVLVGLLYLLALAAVVALAAVLAGGTFATLQPGHRDLQALGTTFGAVILLVMALWIPILMAYWFAPALVALDGLSPFAAMKLSFSACLKNMWPFLIYGVILLILMILAMIPVGLGFFVLVPVMLAAMYASYRDIFYEGGAGLQD